MADRRVVTHRVISVQHGADGTVTVQTKGDANTAVDPWQATLQGRTAYQVRAVIPRVMTRSSSINGDAVRLLGNVKRPNSSMSE